MAAATRYVGPRHRTLLARAHAQLCVSLPVVPRECCADLSVQSRLSSTGAAFVWPDELEELVYVFVRTDLVKRRRQRAAACLTRYVLARLTRRWFVLRARPWLWQGGELLWPHPVAMRVSWDAMRAAHPQVRRFLASL